jgi:hypothetical protein
MLGRVRIASLTVQTSCRGELEPTDFYTIWEVVQASVRLRFDRSRKAIPKQRNDRSFGENSKNIKNYSAWNVRGSSCEAAFIVVGEGNSVRLKTVSAPNLAVLVQNV